MLPADQIRENLQRVRDEIAQAATDAGRDPATVRLVAVSKTLPAAAVEAAYAAGQRDFGENRVEELQEKVPALPADITWHMIGHLQSRKAADAARFSRMVHSIDREKLLSRLAVGAAETKPPAPLPILLQLNVSGEASKSGVSPEQADALLDAVLEQRTLICRGLMTMAPIDADDATLHRVFRGLREARDRLAAKFRIDLPELSMGMSGDYRIAIAEGATLVRIGTAIFGARG